MHRIFFLLNLQRRESFINILIEKKSIKRNKSFRLWSEIAWAYEQSLKGAVAQETKPREASNNF